MFEQKKPMELVRQHGSYRLVKLNKLYFVFSYDPDRDLVRAIIPPDRIVDEYRQERGLTNASVQYVARGRKKSTALAYYNAFIRSRRRAGEKLPEPDTQLSAKHKKEEMSSADVSTDKPLVCGWCNGSGQDPRNLDWHCPKC